MHIHPEYCAEEPTPGTTPTPTSTFAPNPGTPAPINPELDARMGNLVATIEGIILLTLGKIFIILFTPIYRYIHVHMFTQRIIFKVYRLLGGIRFPFLASNVTGLSIVYQQSLEKK